MEAICIISENNADEHIADKLSPAAEISKPGAEQPPLPEGCAKDTLDRLDKLRHSSGGLSTAQIRGKMQRAMQADAAVFRTQVRNTMCLIFGITYSQRCCIDEIGEYKVMMRHFNQEQCMSSS